MNQISLYILYCTYLSEFISIRVKGLQLRINCFRIFQKKWRTSPETNKSCLSLCRAASPVFCCHSRSTQFTPTSEERTKARTWRGATSWQIFQKQISLKRSRTFIRTTCASTRWPRRSCSTSSGPSTCSSSSSPS